MKIANSVLLATAGTLAVIGLGIYLVARNKNRIVGDFKEGVAKGQARIREVMHQSKESLQHAHS
ncbi:MAG TPA: hypothetical protein VL307_16915 [Chitinophagaceae bacterium]|nr:hypothetical protein [Chitinophagaceae bacterium]